MATPTLTPEQADTIAALTEQSDATLALQAEVAMLREALAARERYLPELLRLAVTVHPRFLADAVAALRDLPAGTEV